MQQRIIVFKAKDQAIPAGYLDKLFAAGYTKAIGFAAVIDGKLLIQTNVGFKPDEFRMELKEFNNLETTFVFAKSDHMISEDDVQPWAVLKTVPQEGGKVEDIIALAATGQFQKSFEKPGESRSPEYYLMQHIRTKFMKSFAMGYAKNVNNFVNSLSDMDIVTDLQNTMLGASHIVLIPSVGEVKCIAQAGQAGTPAYPWGWVTDSFGYTEDQATTSTGKLSSAVRFAKSMVGGDKGPSMTETGKPVIASTEPVKPKDAAGNDEKVEYYQCPTNIHGNKEIREAYIKNAGYQPQGYKYRPKVPIKKELVAESAGSSEVYRAFDERFAKKATQPNGTTSSEAKATEPKKGEERPIMKADSIKAIKDLLHSGMVKAELDTNRKLSIADFRQREARIPSFTQEMEISLEDTLYYTHDRYASIGRQDVNALAALACEYRYALVNLLSSPSNSEEKVEKPEVVPAETRTKSRSVPRFAPRAA